MRRRGLATGAALAALAAVALARRRDGSERVEVAFDDGTAVTFDRRSAVGDDLLAVAREAVRAARR